MVKNINDLSLPELKAYAYDLIVNGEQIKNQLQAVNQMISKKLSEPVKKTEEKPIIK